MTDLKISQFADGGAIEPTDEIAAVRAGVNTKVLAGSMAAEDAEDYTPSADLATIATSGLASDVEYDNTASGLTASDAQAAIDELAAESGIPDGDKGDIVVSSGGTVWTIDNGAIGGAKLASGGITSAQMRTAMSDETGSGALVFADGPTLVDPVLTGARLSADFTATSTTTPTGVTGLAIPVVAGRTYQYRFVMHCTSDAASGIKVAIGTSAAATSAHRNNSTIWNGTTVTRNTDGTNLNSGATVYTATAVTATQIEVEGSFVCSTSGSLVPYFAQNVSGATASRVLAGSWISLKRIA